MEKLKSFQENDSDSLYHISKYLFQKTRFFHNYLTSIQFQVVDKVFSIEDKKTSKDVWNHLLNGKLLIKFEDGGSNNDEELDSLIVASKQISLRLKALLWEKATSYYFYLSDVDSLQLRLDNKSNEVFDLLQEDNSDFEDAAQTQAESKEPKEKNEEQESTKARDVDEDDDYDDDDDDDDDQEDEQTSTIGNKKEESNKQDKSMNDPNTYYRDYLVLRIGPKKNAKEQETEGKLHGGDQKGSKSDKQIGLITTKMSTSLNSSETTVTEQELEIIKNLNSVYHNFEYDKGTLLKRQKLEVSDKLVNEEGGANPTESIETDSSLSRQLSMNIGSASLSLKYLLKLIDNNKEKVPNLTSRELRNLIHDVKKTKSKWSSEERIGQEELYEACEKVVIDLRSYTQHSTPFLTKVSKREAPNYYQIIKKPMDLNTVMKKLKNLEYKSKKDFVDDLMLIWANCLTYNTDPNHQLRKDAIAMRQKTASLLPLIPDIVIKTKSEIEKEERELQRKANRNMHGSTGKGIKRTSNGTVVTHDEDNAANAIVVEDTSMIREESNMNSATDTPEPNASTSNKAQIVDDEEESQLEIEANSFNAFDGEGIEEDQDINDIESQVWKNYTSKLRGDFLLRRSQLFKKSDERKQAGSAADINLNEEAEAVLRDPNKMSEFLRIVSSGEYLEELDKSAEDDNSGDTEQNNHKSGDKNGNSLSKKDANDDKQGNDENDLYLTEYDIINGIPMIKFKGHDDKDLDEKEDAIIERLKFQKKLMGDDEEEFGKKYAQSEFRSPKTGINKVIVDNITQMQEIRKICFKISLIRQMQQNQFIHHTQLKAPVFEKIQDIDLNPLQKESESVIFEHKYNKEFIYSLFKKNIAKVLMNTGFETADPIAVDSITQIAENFMSNLIKTIKLHLETTSANKISSKSNILLLSLIENGIPKPDDLYLYVREGIQKQNGKLKELRGKLNHFLKELLRPSLTFNEKELINEKNFGDNSEQFLTGDFSNDLGEDFFGFKELGLDKEFNMLTSSFPIHLLNSKLSNSFYNSQNQNTNSVNLIEEFDKTIKYNRLYKSEIKDQIGLIQPFLEKFFEKSKLIYLKNFKNNNRSNKELPFTNKEEEMVILEDEDLPQKQRNVRPRLPPNGKISSTKKKVVGMAFFIPEDVPKPQTEAAKPAAADNAVTSSIKTNTSIGLNDGQDIDEDDLYGNM